MSFPRYPGYKPSGVEWLGEVPEHWEVKRIASLYSESVEQGNDELPVLSVSIHHGVSDSELSEEEMDRKVVRSEDRSKYKRVAPGDLVYNMMRAWQGAFGSVVVDGMVSPAYVVARPKSDLPSEWIEYLLRTDFAVNEIKRFSRGITDFRLRLYWDEFKNLRICVPPEEDRVSILRFLSHETAKIDALIAEQQRLIELLQEKRQAVISHAVTKGLNPDAPMKDSGVEWLGEVPEHWDIRPIKHLARVGNGSTPNRNNSDYWADHDGFPWLNSSVVNQAEVSEADRFVTKLALRECHLPIIDPPAVLVGITGQGRTRGMASKLMFEATISQHIAYIKPDLHQLTVDFLLCALEAAYERLRFDSEGSGSTKGAITCEQLGLMRMPVPSPPEQVEIVSFLQLEIASNVALKAQSEHAIRLLQERRSALISAAVTGLIDLRGLVLEAEAA